MRRLRRTDSQPTRGRTTSQRVVKHGRSDARTRAVEKANDAWVIASAVVETTELELENALRDIDRILARVDRAHVAQSAQRTVSPRDATALGAAGTAPLDTLPRLRSNLARFADHEDVAREMVRLDRAEAQFRAALKAEKKAQEKVELALIAELEAHGEIGEQGAVLSGRLAERPASRPQRAKRSKTAPPRGRTAERRAG
jgi:hypothetical protein